MDERQATMFGCSRENLKVLAMEVAIAMPVAIWKVTISSIVWLSLRFGFSLSRPLAIVTSMAVAIAMAMSVVAMTVSLSLAVVVTVSSSVRVWVVAV